MKILYTGDTGIVAIITPAPNGVAIEEIAKKMYLQEENTKL